MEDSEGCENGGAISWKEPEPPRNQVEQSTSTHRHPAQSTLHNDMRGKSTHDSLRHLGAVCYHS